MDQSGGNALSKPEIVVAVCIATCRRTDWLKLLLEGLANQKLGAETRLRIVVSDNDPAGSARATIEQFRRRSAHDIIYVHEPRPGIAEARNAALAVLEPSVTHIAFLDDDEIPNSDWLQSLLRGMERFNADVCAGPVLPRFQSPPPAWAIRGGFFNRPRRETGSMLTHAFTGNVLIRRAGIDPRQLRFNERFGRSGGEDREFFRRIGIAGKSIVWIDEAIVEEWVPLERMTPRYLVRRMFRIGAAVSRVELTLVQGIARACVRLVQLVKGAVWFCMGLVTAPLGLMGLHYWIRSRCWGAYGAGLILGTFGMQYKMYGDSARVGSNT